MNDCERELMEDNLLCAAKLAGSWVFANLYTNYTFGYNSSNDCSDAYRHVFFNALNASYCEESLARDFGIARECTSDTELAKEMDLYNNEIEYDIIEQNPELSELLTNFFGSDDTILDGLMQLSSEICERLESGEMYVFSNPDATKEEVINGDVILINSFDCNCSKN